MLILWNKVSWRITDTQQYDAVCNEIFQLYHGENKLIFNEMMNMRGDEGDSESERYTS
jgi:hypothetical protein